MKAILAVLAALAVVAAGCGGGNNAAEPPPTPTLVATPEPVATELPPEPSEATPTVQPSPSEPPVVPEPGATATAIPLVTPPPVEVVCPEGFSPVDSNGDGQDETCEPDATPEPTAVEPPPATAVATVEPTVAATIEAATPTAAPEVTATAEPTVDPTETAEPTADPTPTPFAVRVYPLDVSELGCDLVSPPLCSQHPPDMLPTADRVPTADELRGMSYNDGDRGAGWLPSRARPPARHGDAYSLSVITACLRSWPEYRPDTHYPYDGPPIARCWGVWMFATLAVDHYGADPACVWEHLERVFLIGGRGGWQITPYSIHTGWGEFCESGLDSGWVLDDGRRIAFESRCADLARTISPAMFESLGIGVISAMCSLRASSEESWNARGRCMELDSLAEMARRFAYTAERNGHPVERPDLVLPDAPDGIRIIC